MERRSRDRAADAARQRLELLALELAGESRRPRGSRVRGDLEDVRDREGLGSDEGLGYEEGLGSNEGLGYEEVLRDDLLRDDLLRDDLRSRLRATVPSASGPAHAGVGSLLGQGVERRHVLAVLGLAAVAVIAALWWVGSARPESIDAAEVMPVEAAASAEPGATAPATAATSTAAAAPDVVVDVAGKVRRPGIVVLPDGSRVVDAIDAAGGARRGADLTPLNLARVLTDGEQVLVGIPTGVAVAPGSSAATGDAPVAPVNLNTATLEELDTLPGVGPVTAQAIVDWRTSDGPFASVEQLVEVSGIGEATLDELRDLVTV